MQASRAGGSGAKQDDMGSCPKYHSHRRFAGCDGLAAALGSRDYFYFGVGFVNTRLDLNGPNLVRRTCRSRYPGNAVSLGPLATSLYDKIGTGEAEIDALVDLMPPEASGAPGGDRECGPNKKLTRNYTVWGLWH
jgi:hypothetical protein